MLVTDRVLEIEQKIGLKGKLNKVILYFLPKMLPYLITFFGKKMKKTFFQLAIKHIIPQHFQKPVFGYPIRHYSITDSIFLRQCYLQQPNIHGRLQGRRILEAVVQS